MYAYVTSIKSECSWEFVEGRADGWRLQRLLYGNFQTLAGSKIPALQKFVARTEQC